MSGTVSWEILFWVGGLMAGAGVVVAGFLFWVWRIVSAIDARFTARMAEIALANGAETARARLAEEHIAREHAELRQHVAETYATKDGVTTAIGRMEQAMERLTSQLDASLERLTGRLDRVLETRTNTGRARQGE
jgi:hypothetical protein